MNEGPGMNKLAAGLALLLACPAVLGAQNAGSPRLNYVLHCAGCHGIDGNGDLKGGIPTLRGTIGHFLKVEGGREYLVQVPGASQSPLSDGETAELLNWMLKAFSAADMPADAKAYSAAEVGCLRRNQPADVPRQRSEVTDRLFREHGIDLKSYR